MMIEVECYAGYRYPEHPRSFQLKQRKYRVEQVIDRWFGTMELYFKVLAEDQKIYLLKYSPSQESWTLAGMFQPAGHYPLREEN